MASNSMKSSNPYSGCRKVEIAKTLDCFDPNPSKNQGGVAVVTAGFDGTKGSKARGIGYEVEKAMTTTTSGGALPDTVGALCARDYKGVGNQYVNEGKVIVDTVP